MLTQFIKQSGLTQTAFAVQIGVSKSHLSTLISGRRQPSLELAVQIERATGGAVPATSWIPEPVPAADASADAITPHPETPSERDAA